MKEMWPLYLFKTHIKFIKLMFRVECQVTNLRRPLLISGRTAERSTAPMKFYFIHFTQKLNSFMSKLSKLTFLLNGTPITFTWVGGANYLQGEGILMTRMGLYALREIFVAYVMTIGRMHIISFYSQWNLLLLEWEGGIIYIVEGF